MLRVMGDGALPASGQAARYLMGVGTPHDMIEGGGARHRHVRLRHADPGRAARADIFTARGRVNQNARHADPGNRRDQRNRQRAVVTICIIWSRTAALGAVP